VEGSVLFWLWEAFTQCLGGTLCLDLEPLDWVRFFLKPIGYPAHSDLFGTAFVIRPAFNKKNKNTRKEFIYEKNRYACAFFS